MAFDANQIISYREMCNEENQQQLQHGMNFMAGGKHSIVLMSFKSNAPYAYPTSDNELTIYYEVHDAPEDKTKSHGQP